MEFVSPVSHFSCTDADNQIQNLLEGVPEVPARATCRQLLETAHRHLGPGLQREYPGFVWDWDRLALRELGSWVDLRAHDPDVSVFYSRCLKTTPHGTSGTSITKFKAPSTPFKVAWVIDAPLMHEINEFVERCELEVSHIVLVHTSSRN